MRRSINERIVASTRRVTAKALTSAAPTILGVSTGCLSRPSKNLQIYCVPSSRSTAPSRPPFPRTPLDEMPSCIHQHCCTERESVFYRQFRTPRSLIAQSDSKIACRYYFQVDYELCARDIPGTVFFENQRVSSPLFIVYNFHHVHTTG